MTLSTRISIVLITINAQSKRFPGSSSASSLDRGTSRGVAGVSFSSIRFLVEAGLLKGLGQTHGVQLMFATIYVRRLAIDEKWLMRATEAVRKHHRDKNAKQKSQRSAYTEKGFSS